MSVLVRKKLVSNSNKPPPVQLYFFKSTTAAQFKILENPDEETALVMTENAVTKAIELAEIDLNNKMELDDRST